MRFCELLWSLGSCWACLGDTFCSIVLGIAFVLFALSLRNTAIGAIMNSRRELRLEDAGNDASTDGDRVSSFSESWNDVSILISWDDSAPPESPWIAGGRSGTDAYTFGRGWCLEPLLPKGLLLPEFSEDLFVLLPRERVFSSWELLKYGCDDFRYLGRTVGVDKGLFSSDDWDVMDLFFAASGLLTMDMG